jgi:hypothetical protein
MMFTFGKIPTMPAWAEMWLLAFTIYVFCKAISWAGRTETGSAWRHIAFLFAWPGMDCNTFLKSNPSGLKRPSSKEWLFAMSKMGFGIGLIWWIVPAVRQAGMLIQTWVGMIGLVFVLHFGLFHLLACFWRQMGVAAAPIMNWPIRSQSLAEFWGRRWNLAFRDLTYRYVFSPLHRRLGPTGAVLAGFAVSGLIHDLVISLPSGGGWGLPTAFFAIQGTGLVFERTFVAKQWGLGHGIAGWIYSVALIAIPSPLLFHRAFITKVMYPFLVAIGTAA